MSPAHVTRELLGRPRATLSARSREDLSASLEVRFAWPSRGRSVLPSLDTRHFATCFGAWMGALADASAGRLLVADGKALRGSYDRARGRSALRLVSVWAAANQVVLAQRAVDEDSNEATALPALLRTLDLSGAVVSVDAGGCSKATAQAIVDGGGDYVLHLKANARTLHAHVATFFRDARATGFAGVAHRYVETVDDGHGRHEVRRVWAVAERSWLGVADDWPQLRSAVCVERTRTVDDRTSVEAHDFLSSLPARSAVTFADAIRGHWTIENQLHWSLDVQMREDASRIRDRNAAQNFAALRRGAVSLLKQDTRSKLSLRRKQRQAAMDPEYLATILVAGMM